MMNNSYLYGAIVKKIIVSKVGKRGQLYYLDNVEIKMLKQKLERDFNLNIFDVIEKNNFLEINLKQDVFDNNFNAFISEVNNVFNINGYGFFYKKEKTLDNVCVFEQLVSGNQGFLVNSDLFNSGYNMSIYVSSFFKHYEDYYCNNEILSNLLTHLSRGTIKNILSKAVIFFFD